MTIEHKSKSLGFWMLTSLVSGNMIGSGVFLLPAALALYGTIGIFSWVLTAIGAIFLALVFSRLGALLPKTGGPYTFCYEAFGEYIGFQTAYNYWIALCVGNAAIVIAAVGYLTVFFPILSTNHVYSLLTTLGILWLITGLNIWGVRQAGIFQLITTILKLVPLAALAFIGLFFIHKHNLMQFNVSGHSNFSALTAAATLTLWSFIGVESATVPADNVENPEKNIPRATIIGTVVTAIIYIISTVAIMGIIPLSNLAHTSSPFADAAVHIFGQWGRIVIGLAAVISCVGTLNGWVLMQAQVPLAAARDKLFPKRFATLNKRGSPAFGLVVSSLLITVLLFMGYNATLVRQFTLIILLATMASLIPYFFTSLAEIILFIRKPDLVPKKVMIRSVIIAILATFYSFWAIAGSGQQIIYYGTLLLLSSVPIYVWMKWRE